MRNFAVALAGAVVSLVYWTAVATVGFVAAAGDVAPGAPPRAAATMELARDAVVVAALVVYALGTLAWRRLETRLTSPRA